MLRVSGCGFSLLEQEHKAVLGLAKGVPRLDFELKGAGTGKEIEKKAHNKQFLASGDSDYNAALTTLTFEFSKEKVGRDLRGRRYIYVDVTNGASGAPPHLQSAGATIGYVGASPVAHGSPTAPAGPLPGTWVQGADHVANMDWVCCSSPPFSSVRLTATAN
ncbi:MAG: hypothetical protein GY722_17540 [bacterium]|nr:hypothetical protein [bacterium]